MATDVLPIFVYGTLKRGQERESHWPALPLDIRTATTRGRLHDLGPYPALVAGDDVIGGELWFIAAADMDRTLATLDAIEGYQQHREDLYVRRIVVCQDKQGNEFRAHTYFFAIPERIAETPVVPPAAEGICLWPIA